MNYPQAIVAAAGILAGAIIMTNMGQTASDRYPADSGSRYLVAATPGQKVANAWRIDTQTGEIYRCFATGGMYGAVCRLARFYGEDDSHRDDADGPGPDGAKFPAARKLAKWSR